MKTARPVPEHHLHLTGGDAVEVRVVPTPVPEGSTQVVTVADQQVPLSKVIHHEVANAHGPLPQVALAVHEALVPATLVLFAWLEAELRGVVVGVAVGGRRHLRALHVVRDEASKGLVHSVRVWPADLHNTVPLWWLISRWICPELDEYQVLLGFLRALGELHLLLTEDLVRAVPGVWRDAPAVAKQ